MKSIIVAMIGLLPLSAFAKAGATAHCFCKIRSDAGGLEVKDFGELNTYSGMNPQKPDNQKDCRRLCKNAAENWQSNSTEVWRAFYTAKSPALLKAWAHVGNNSEDWVANSITPPRPSSTVVNPTHHLMTILYALPGCTKTASYDCSSSPSTQATYSTGASMSVTTSIEDSFKTDRSLTVDLGLTFPNGMNFGYSQSNVTSYSVTSTSGSSETISKNSSNLVTESPLTGDGIDHGWDEFEILLNPVVILEHDCVKYGNGTGWNMGYKPPLQSQKLKACEILGRCGSIPPPVLNAKLTPADYCSLLAQDPFVDHCAPTFQPTVWPSLVNPQDLIPPNLQVDPATLQPGRFEVTTYEPIYDAADPGGCSPIWTQQVENDYQSSDTSSTQAETTESTSMGATISSENAANFGLTKTNTFTFTHSVSQVNTKSRTQSASVTIACAGTDWYQNPNAFYNIAVYWDKIFSSFLFVPAPVNHRVIHHGRVTNALGAPLRREPVQLSYGGKTYHTVTDKHGDYKIYSAAIKTDPQHPLPAKLTVRGVTTDITLGLAAAAAIHIPVKQPDMQLIPR